MSLSLMDALADVDLAPGQKKSSVILVAVVREAKEMVRHGVLKAADIQGPIRGGRVFGWYYLPGFEPTGLPESVVDGRGTMRPTASLVRRPAFESGGPQRMKAPTNWDSDIR